jgi:protein transport protein SEC61 subunit gamma and related proteins
VSDSAKQLLDIPREFFKDSLFFVNRCTKPNKRGIIPFSHWGYRIVLIEEFLEISRGLAVGILIMGFIGFTVKLVHIPINNILVSSVEGWD